MQSLSEFERDVGRPLTNEERDDVNLFLTNLPAWSRMIDARRADHYAQWAATWRYAE